MAEAMSVPSTQRINGSSASTYQDGGVLDFGREHVFLDEIFKSEVTLPQRLVEFISEQAIKEHQKGQAHHG